jgi:hypothetical protein
MNDESVKRKLQYELVFDYESKDPNSEELIYLEFIEYYNKDCNMVFIKIKRFDGSDLKISMNDPCDRIEFHNGPKLVIGGDFFGKGIIKSLCPVKTGLGIKSIRVEVK